MASQAVTFARRYLGYIQREQLEHKLNVPVSCIVDVAFASVATAFFALVDNFDASHTDVLSRSLIHFIQTWKDRIVSAQTAPVVDVNVQPIFNTTPDAITSIARSIMMLANSQKLEPTAAVRRLVHTLKELRDDIENQKKVKPTNVKNTDFLQQCVEWVKGNELDEKNESEASAFDSEVLEELESLSILSPTGTEPQATDFRAIIEAAIVRVPFCSFRFVLK